MGFFPAPALSLVMHHPAGGKSRGPQPRVWSAVSFLLLLVLYFQLSIIQAQKGNITGLCQEAWKSCHSCYLQYLKLFLINFLPFICLFLNPHGICFSAGLLKQAKFYLAYCLFIQIMMKAFVKAVYICYWCIIHSFPKAEFPWQLINKD